MLGKFYIAKKGALYLCMAAPVGIVATDPGPRVSHIIAKAKHQVNHITHRKIFKESAPVTPIRVEVVTIPAICQPGDNGGFYGGGNFGGGGYYGGGAEYNMPSYSGGGNGGGLTPAPITSSVPELSTWAMMGIGVGSVGLVLRGKRKAAIKFH